MSADETKVILVTGASGGIGSVIASTFAQQKVCLSLCAIDEENFDKVVEECKTAGAIEVMKIVTDLIIKENMEMVMKKTIDEFGRLDVLVNCAGIGIGGSIRDVRLENYDKVMSVNSRTPLYLTQLAIPHLEKTKGNIVNISSGFSTLCTPSNVLSYCLSKATIDRLTKMTALDLASSGIRVNSINPSFADTPLIDAAANLNNIEPDVFRKMMADHNPLNKRLIECREIADAVIFLASDKAQMITGVHLPVDGGRLLTGK